MPYHLRAVPYYSDFLTDMPHIFGLFETYNFYTALPKEFPAWQVSVTLIMLLRFVNSAAHCISIQLETK